MRPVAERGGCQCRYHPSRPPPSQIVRFRPSARSPTWLLLSLPSSSSSTSPTPSPQLPRPGSCNSVSHPSVTCVAQSSVARSLLESLPPAPFSHLSRTKSQQEPPPLSKTRRPPVAAPIHPSNTHTSTWKPSMVLMSTRRAASSPSAVRKESRRSFT